MLMSIISNVTIHIICHVARDTCCGVSIRPFKVDVRRFYNIAFVRKNLVCFSNPFLSGNYTSDFLLAQVMRNFFQNCRTVVATGVTNSGDKMLQQRM